MQWRWSERRWCGLGVYCSVADTRQGHYCSHGCMGGMGGSICTPRARRAARQPRLRWLGGKEARLHLPYKSQEECVPRGVSNVPPIFEVAESSSNLLVLQSSKVFLSGEAGHFRPQAQMHHPRPRCQTSSPNRFWNPFSMGCTGAAASQCSPRECTDRTGWIRVLLCSERTAGLNHSPSPAFDWIQLQGDFVGHLWLKSCSTIRAFRAATGTELESLLLHRRVE